MKAPLVLRRESFEVPPEAMKKIEEWMLTLPEIDQTMSSSSRYEWTFVDGGVVDFIHVRDRVSDQKISWCPDIEDW